MRCRLALFCASLGTLGCGGADDLGCEDDQVCECVGDLKVTVRLDPVPGKLRIVWNGRVVVDDCGSAQAGPVILERRAGELVIDDGGFGYTPPSRFDLTIVDLKDCVLPAESLFALTGRDVPEAPFGLCEQAAATVE